MCYPKGVGRGGSEGSSDPLFLGKSFYISTKNDINWTKTILTILKFNLKRRPPPPPFRILSSPLCLCIIYEIDKCGKTSRFILICLRSLVWSLNCGEYEDLEARQHRPSVKGGSEPMERSRRALESLMFSYAEVGVPGRPSVFSPWTPNH